MNQQEIAWSKRTENLADFASPWSHAEGFRAYAYPVARTFNAAREGFKGKRKSVMFHMLNSGEAGSLSCTVCEGVLREPAKAFARDMGNDTRVESPEGKVEAHSTWTFYPGKGFSGGMHYVCSWSMLFGRIAAIRDV